MTDVTKTHCPRGHPYTGENLALRADGSRRCRQCARDYAALKWRKDNPVPKPRGRKKVDSPAARRRLWCPDHPLADKAGYALEARVVLFDKIGLGPHPCHWCGGLVEWTKDGLRPGALVADHLDFNGHNNAPGNMVPACQSCNGHRWSSRVKEDELFIARPDGTRLRAVQRRCERCAAPFLIAPAALTRPNRGRFCSMSCARSKPHVRPPS